MKDLMRITCQDEQDQLTVVDAILHSFRWYLCLWKKLFRKLHYSSHWKNSNTQLIKSDLDDYSYISLKNGWLELFEGRYIIRSLIGNDIALEA